jgi:hypothetical protein
MWTSSHLPNMGLGCYKLPLSISSILVRATSCNVSIPHDLMLLGGLDTICNNPEKSASHIYTIT